MCVCVCVCVCLHEHVHLSRISVTVPFVKISLDELDPFSFVPHLSLTHLFRSPSLPPQIYLSFGRCPSPVTFFSQSGALLLLYCMAERLLRCSLCRGGRHTCTQRSVQPVTFGAALQPSLQPEVTEIAHTQTLRQLCKPGSFPVRLDLSKRAKIRHCSS